MQKGLSDYFSSTGWQVLAAASTLRSAKKALEEITPDLLLLDIHLNENETDNINTDNIDNIQIDSWGLDIIPWLQEKTAEKKIDMPLLAVYSAFDDYAHVSSALNLGVKAYVTKRHNEKELEKILLKAFEGESYIDETAKMKLKQITTLSCFLTKREAEILKLVKTGLSNNEIAAKLGISFRTVQNILSCIYDKTGIKSRKELERL